MGKQDDFFKTQFRIPTDLYGEIKDAAEDDERSINGQVVYLLRIALKEINAPISEESLRQIIKEELAKQRPGK